MSERNESSSSELMGKDAPTTNSEQSSQSTAAGTGDNPQDGGDDGQSGESRPRGKTEDPDRTL